MLNSHFLHTCRALNPDSEEFIYALRVKLWYDIVMLICHALLLFCHEQTT